MPESMQTHTILCPHCGRRYQDQRAPTPDDFAADAPDAAFVHPCPHCQQPVDLRQLNALTLREGVLYLDYTVYPDLIESYLPPLDHNPAAIYLYRLTSARSRTVMSQSLRTVAALLTGQEAYNADILGLRWGAVRYAHTAALRARLSAVYSPATANRILSALRGVLKEAWRLGQMSADDYQRAIDVPNVSGETVPAGRDLDEGEVLALVKACVRDKSPAGIRDAAIIGVLYTSGLRRAEVAALAVSDFEPEGGRLLVRSGKGRKGRAVYAQGGALAALQDWLTLRGAEAGALFLSINKGGRIEAKGMTAQAIYSLLKKRAREAAVKDFSPHDFRRTFVGDLLDRGVDIVTVQKLAGHANPNTTARYDRRPEETKRQATAKLHFPYQRRLR